MGSPGRSRTKVLSNWSVSRVAFIPEAVAAVILGPPPRKIAEFRETPPRAREGAKLCLTVRVRNITPARIHRNLPRTKYEIQTVLEDLISSTL